MQKTARLKFLASVILFGTIGVFRQLIPYPSSVIAFVRGLVGALFLCAVMVCLKMRPDRAGLRKNRGILCVSGALIGANWVLLFEAYRYTSVAVATLCYYMAPVLVILASPLVLHERLSARRLVCAALSVAGMVLIWGVAGAGGASAAGILLGLASAVLYAGVILMNKFIKDISAYEQTIAQLGTAALVLLPYVLLTEDVRALPASGPVLFLLLVVGVVHTGAAYALYFSGIRFIPAQTAALLSYVDPLVAIALSALVLKERLTPLTAVGAALVLGATVAGELPARQR